MDFALNSNGEKVYATDLDFSDKDKIFKCPNPACDGEFKPRALNSNYRLPHFYYYEGLKSHIHKCWCLENDNSSKYNASNFKLNDFLGDLINHHTKTSSSSKSSNSSPHDPNEQLPIKTLLQLFKYCSSNSTDKYVGDTVIHDLIVDDRTFDSYKNSQSYDNKIHLYYLQRFSFDYDTQLLTASCYKNEHIFMSFKIKFPSKKILENFIEGFFKTKSGKKRTQQKKSFIALAKAGELEATNSQFFKTQYLIIDSIKQLKIL